MAIIRNHEVGEVPGVVEMNPTSLPELLTNSWDHIRSHGNSRGVNSREKIMVFGHTS